MAQPMPADRRVGDRKQRLVVAGEVVRAGVDLVRNPRVHLAVLGEDAVRADQARRVEDDAGPARIGLEHRAALDVDVVLARLGREPIGVLVRDRHGELLEQLGDGREDRRGVRELGEHDEPHRQERRAAGHRRIDHRQHAIGVGAHLRAVDRVGEVGLTRRGGVADQAVAHRRVRSSERRQRSRADDARVPALQIRAMRRRVRIPLRRGVRIARHRRGTAAATA